MFTALSEQLTGVLNRLRGRGVLSESDVTDALREIRRHLLEADVSFEVTRGFVERVRERAGGGGAAGAGGPAGWSAGVWGCGRDAACCARTKTGAGRAARVGDGAGSDRDR